jgi:DNA polymerase-3 subunit delta
VITTIAGPNNILVQQELDRLRTEFVKKHGNLALEQLDAEDAEAEKLAEAMQSLPFLAGKKLVVIKNPSANKQFASQFETLIKNVPETTDVVLVEPRPDKRTAFYKSLQKLTEFKEFKELEARELPNWLVREAKSRGGSITPADARYVVERVGPSQQLLSSELDKLLIFQPNISRQTIDELTEPAPQSSIFELLDAAFAGQTQRMQALYEQQRAQKVEPGQIMAMIAWQLHILAVVKTAGERSADQIAREASLNPFVVRKSQNITKNLSYKQLKDLVHRAYLLDIKLKSQTIDADEALQHFLLTISS